MNRRATIKWRHWLSLGLILYFFAIEPEDVERLGAAALATHAGVSLIFAVVVLIFAVVVLIWFSMFLAKGLAGRAGPKIPDWGKRWHPLGHKAKYCGLLAIAVSGGLIGLFAPYLVLAFGVIPIMPSLDVKTLHDVAQEVHEVIFDALLIGIVAHAAFHLWRHFWLGDNALRIMVPKALHRYL